jgi:hypothetical protein
MPHIVLLGDSVFDNGAYVGNGPDVISQLRGLLPSGWQATLNAVDGSTTRTLSTQIAQIPADATHLVLSVGGNDALMLVDVFTHPVATVGEALSVMASVVDEFDRDYRLAVAAVLRTGLPTVLCTIYNGSFPDPEFQGRATTAAALLNDAILRAARERRLAVIDLRLICSRDEDFANPIEPSSVGGEKIARSVVEAVAPSAAFE